MTSDSLTVVICNWGTPDLTIRSAKAVRADGVPARRIVVVDNGSEDDSYTRFQEELAGCVLVRLDENIGFARASNLGAAELPGEAYLFVNNDAFAERPGSVEALLGSLDDEQVGVAAPRILNPDLTLQSTVVPISSPLVELVRASGVSRFLPNAVQPGWSTHWDHAEAREIQAVNGAVLLVRAATWEQLDGFSERAYMYAEDLDLCWRARLAGWKVWFTPESEFVHLGNVASGRHWSSPQRAEMIGRSEAHMIRTHRSRPSAALTVGLIAAGLAARWLVFTATGRREAAASLRGGLRGYLGRGAPRMTVYARVKSVYRAVLPDAARSWLHAHAPDFVLAARYRVVSRLERRAETDELYDAYYYDHDVDPLMLSSAEAMASSLAREFQPTSAIDVGCGTGALMAALQRLGVRCLGFDYATAALERCRERGVEARRLDLERDPFPPERADLAISTEVAEHLPERSADRFVELLTTLAPVVVVTAALPGSRGKDHVNEQPNEYWIEKFSARRFTFEHDLTTRLRDEWRDAGVAETFFRSLIVFRAEA